MVLLNLKIMSELGLILRIVFFVVVTAFGRFVLQSVLKNLNESELSRFQSINGSNPIAIISGIITLALSVAFLVVNFWATSYQWISPILILVFFVISLIHLVANYLMLGVFLPKIAVNAYLFATLMRLIGIAVLLLPFWSGIFLGRL